MKQTQVYIFILEEFILLYVGSSLYKLKIISIGNYTGIYTIATMDEKCEKCN